MYGSYLHLLTSSVAARDRIGSPLIPFTLVIFPCLLMVASICTAPWMCICIACGGYTGCTRLVSSPCVTPCETRRVCCWAATLGTATAVDWTMFEMAL